MLADRIPSASHQVPRTARLTWWIVAHDAAGVKLFFQGTGASPASPAKAQEGQGLALLLLLAVLLDNPLRHRNLFARCNPQDINKARTLAAP